MNRESIWQSTTEIVKGEYLRWIFVLVSTIASYLILAWVITQIYTPDIELISKQTAEIVFHTSVNPEPVETLLYQLGLLFIPCCILLYDWIGKKINFAAIGANRFLFSTVTILASVAFVGWIWVGFMMDNPFHSAPENERDLVAVTHAGFYFKGLFLHNYFWLCLFVIYPLVLILFFRLCDKLKWDDSEKTQNIISVITWGLLALFLLFIIIPLNSFGFPYTWQNKYEFNTIFYSQAQVYGGGAMLLDGLYNNYGLYPHFLHPLFCVTGLDVRLFSTVMAVLLALCFVFQAFFLHAFLRHKLFFFFGCAAILFMPYLNMKLLVAFTASFNTWPVRYLTFSTLLFVSSFYIKTGKTWIYYLVSVLLSMLILWNPEMGIVSFLSWIALLCYMNFYTHTATGLKVSGLRLVKHIVIPLAILAGVCLLYGLLILLSYGAFPDFMLLFNVMAGFGSLGVGALPMPLIHPWNFVALMYVLGLIYSITKLMNKTITPTSGAVFLLSILGSGLFMYYVGRSHHWPLTGICCPALMLLAILCNELWLIVKKHQLISLRILFAIAFFLLTFSAVEIVADLSRIVALTNDEQDRISQLDTEKMIKTNQSFITKHVTPGQKVLMFTGCETEALYLAAAQIRSAANPNFTEMLYHKERSRYEHIVRDSTFMAFLEPAGAFSSYTASYTGNIYAALAATYQIDDTNGSMFLLTKRKKELGYQPVLHSNSPQQVFYELFSDDTTGVNKRIDYSFGKNPLALGSHFSVDIVFDAAPQPFPHATLMSNQADQNNGFSILCADSYRNIYYFVLGSTAFLMEVLPDQRNHIRVFVNHSNVDIVVNGTTTNQYLTPNVYVESPAYLRIGNSTMHYYFGAIREIAIQKY